MVWTRSPDPSDQQDARKSGRLNAVFSIIAEGTTLWFYHLTTSIEMDTAIGGLGSLAQAELSNVDPGDLARIRMVSLCRRVSCAGTQGGFTQV